MGSLRLTVLDAPLQVLYLGAHCDPGRAAPRAASACR